VDDAVEAELLAVGVVVHETPATAVAHLVAFDGHAEAPRPEPLDEELGLHIGAEDEVAWRVDLVGDDNTRDAGFGGDLQVSHDDVPSDGYSCLCGTHLAADHGHHIGGI